MKAVHFGAGNIGRGFVGLLLHQAGYEVVFADVATELMDQLAAADSYTVTEVGQDARTHTVTGFRAVNSATHPERVVAEIADADVVTTAVGAHILQHLAAAIADGIAARDPALGRVAVMACENAINGTDILADHVEAAWAAADHPGSPHDRAIFANTAVDRIVPPQEPGLDVTVETYLEWAVEAPPFDGDHPTIDGITWVDDLEPSIERKLFTVNTGHATAAWFGHAAGIDTIADAIADDDVAARVRAVLAETATLVVAKHGIDAAAQADYVDTILARFANPHLPDTTARVGRAPLRKLGRHDRFISPACQLAERDLPTVALMEAVGAGLAFTASGDDEAARLQELLATASASEVVAEVMNLSPDHPLHPSVLARVQRRQDELSAGG